MRECLVCRAEFEPRPDVTALTGEGLTTECGPCWERSHPTTGPILTRRSPNTAAPSPDIPAREKDEDPVDYAFRILRERAPHIAEELASRSSSMTGPEIAAKKELLGKVMADARPEKDMRKPDPMKNVPLQRLLEDVRREWESGVA